MVTTSIGQVEVNLNFLWCVLITEGLRIYFELIPILSSFILILNFRFINRFVFPWRQLFPNNEEQEPYIVNLPL